MPGLVRKLLIFAGIHGLILQPLGAKKSQATQIAYKDSSIGSTLKDGAESESSGNGFEAFGIVGELCISILGGLVLVAYEYQIAGASSLS